MIPADWFELARERIRPHTAVTPLTYDSGNELYLKWENRQVTGSFKLRGALNKVLALEEWERSAGLVAVSAGNHGQGVALAARLSHTTALIFVPRKAAPNKVEAIEALGGEVRHFEGGYVETEAEAKKFAADHGQIFISPYNDAQIIAGQGTIALEVAEQLKAQYGVDAAEVGNWIVPTGGGGLISGCGSALAGRGIKAWLVGVQPEASAFTYGLIKRGTQVGVTDGPTLADGLSGGMDDDSMTVPLMRSVMNDIVVVSEEVIARGIAAALWKYDEKIEGSAAAALGAALEGVVTRRPAVVVLTGGNIDKRLFDDVLRRHPKGAPA